MAGIAAGGCVVILGIVVVLALSRWLSKRKENPRYCNACVCEHD